MGAVCSFVIMRLSLLAAINAVVYIGVDIFSTNYMFIIVAASIAEAVVSFLIMKFVLFPTPKFGG